jgi:ATP-dependent DNA helicase RecG
MNLSDNFYKYFRLQENQKHALSKLNIETINDILFHFPVRYGDESELNQIGLIMANNPPSPKATAGQGKVVIFGKIKNLKLGKTFRSRIAKADATIEDESGTIKATWFNQPYIAKIYKEGQPVKITGKVSLYNGKPFLNNPEIEVIEAVPMNSDSLFNKNFVNKKDQFLIPIYKLSNGISSRWFYHTIKKILTDKSFKDLEEYIPNEILEKYNLPKLQTALIWMHTPKNQNDALSARKRFAFEEVFLIQLQRQLQKKENESKKSYLIDIKKNTFSSFIEKLPFELTQAQEKAIKEIFHDLETPHAMSRLLEGDVGSGKTVIAAATTYCVVNTQPPASAKDYGVAKQSFGNLQVAYMAPTEVLAKQLFENFIKFFEGTNIKIGLMTSSGCYKFPSKVNKENYTNISRAQLLKWVANGEIPILIGTHSLIQKSVKFKHLAYVIIDEQHRFGTNQRAHLAKKDEFLPHLLSMTATPIPRTLALTIYGDLDLTILDQMPTGRKPVETEIVEKLNRKKTYEKIRNELKSGRQVYVICPRIEEPDPEKLNTLIAKSVKEEARNLRENIFSEFKIGEMHSKLKKDEKEKIMKQFENHEIDILVSTSVIEVGVNIPNATNIIIEGAERFGLAQLHQLRGRVLRSNHQAYCYLFTESKSEITKERLSAIKNAKNGFELAEYDLKIRGAGELGGGKQWGISDIGMEAIKNLKMVEAARNEAVNFVSKLETRNTKSEAKKKLETSKLLEKIKNKKEIHFE